MNLNQLFPSLGLSMPQVDLQEVMDHLAHNTERRTYPLWQHEDCLCFVVLDAPLRFPETLNRWANLPALLGARG